MNNTFINLVEQINSETQSFHSNIESDTLNNQNFRNVLFTSSNLQLVVMSLKPNEDIGEEIHTDTDQFIRVDQGSGKAVLGDKEVILKDGDALIIPKGLTHNVIASEDGLKLYTIYSPPHHEEGTVVK